jgi:hypothetical protein
MLPEKLRRVKTKIRSLKPEEQSVPYYVETWRRHLGLDQDLEFLALTCPCQVSRGNLFRLAANARQSGSLEDIRRVFLGAMLWGYGTVGYGSWRTQRMLATPDSGEMLKRTFDLIAENRIEEAYSGFRLDRCGPSFFTKFFYFSGFEPSSRRYPLILDAVVRRSLMSFADADLSDFADTSQRNPRGYIHYIQLMHEWAQELNCEAHNIELFLFSEART